MKSNNFDLLGIGELLSSPDTSLNHDLQCAALQLLEHAAEWQSANFAQCSWNILDPVAKLVADSPNLHVHHAALDTLKPFMKFPHVAKSRIPDVVNAVSDDLESPDPLVQLASVELLEAASRSEEILARFSTVVSRMLSVLSSMPLATQVTALKVVEASACSNAREPVKAVAETFHYLIEPLSSPEAALQTAALKVLEAAKGRLDNQLADAVNNIISRTHQVYSESGTSTSSQRAPPPYYDIPPNPQQTFKGAASHSMRLNTMSYAQRLYASAIAGARYEVAQNDPQNHTVRQGTYHSDGTKYGTGTETSKKAAREAAAKRM